MLNTRLEEPRETTLEALELDAGDALTTLGEMLRIAMQPMIQWTLREREAGGACQG